MLGVMTKRLMGEEIANIIGNLREPKSIVYQIEVNLLSIPGIKL